MIHPPAVRIFKVNYNGYYWFNKKDVDEATLNLVKTIPSKRYNVSMNRKSVRFGKKWLDFFRELLMIRSYRVVMK